MVKSILEQLTYHNIYTIFTQISDILALYAECFYTFMKIPHHILEVCSIYKTKMLTSFITQQVC